MNVLFMIFQTRIHNLTDWIFWRKPRFYWFCRGRLKCNDQNVWDFELRQRREASVCRHRYRCGRPPGILLLGPGQHQTLATIIWWVLHRSAVVCFMVAALVKYFQEQQCNCRLWLPSWDRWMNLSDFVATAHFWQRYGDRDKERHAFGAELADPAYHLSPFFIVKLPPIGALLQLIKMGKSWPP